MKIQEVILRALSKQISWWQAGEILGISDRHMRRMRERYQQIGYDGLFNRRLGQPSPKRVPLKTVEKVLRLYRERYGDFSVRHFHEKLEEEHKIRLSYTWVKLALQGAGLVARDQQRRVHRRRRERRPIPGMMLHIDGSTHQWFGDERWYDLIVILDDATSEVYYAQLVEEESTFSVMAGLKQVIERKGLFCTLYSDRASHFWLTPKAGEAVDRQRLTQVGRALRDLGVQMIPAYSPQARGRSERNFRTWQGRLPQELRVRAIKTLQEANAFLEQEYRVKFNGRFQVRSRQEGTAFVPLGSQDLNLVFSIHSQRVVNRDHTVSFQDMKLQMERVKWKASLTGCQVIVHRHLDESLSITHGPHLVARYTASGEPWEKSKNVAAGAVEKKWGGKVPKADFPTPLGNPAERAGFPLSHSLGPDYL